MKAAMELAPYLWPKRKAIEHTGDVGAFHFGQAGHDVKRTGQMWCRYR